MRTRVAICYCLCTSGYILASTLCELQKSIQRNETEAGELRVICCFFVTAESL